MVAEPMAAAIGVGLPVETPTGNMVIDIGGGTTEIAVIALSGIVSDTSIRTGGDELDQAIVQFMRKNYNLLVGEPTAEAIKIKIGSAAPTGDEREMEVKGRDLVSGIPKTVRVHSDRNPRGGPGADSADRGRGAPRPRDHAPRARQRHRGPRHRHDRRWRAHPRARHPARAGNRAAHPRRRGPAHLRGAGHRSHSRRLREIPQRPVRLSMASASERSYTRRDTVMFVVCLALSVAGAVRRRRLGHGHRGRRSARPCWRRSSGSRSAPKRGKTSRDRLRAITAQRDSASYLAQGLPSLLAENERLRQLLALSRRLSSPYVAAEVLHQSQATDGRTLLLSAGSRDGVAPFDPVVAPEGLIGVVLSAAERTSIVMTWAHPGVPGQRLHGHAATRPAWSRRRPRPTAAKARSSSAACRIATRCRPGRWCCRRGSAASIRKGIPVGTVTGVVREQAGWERVYRLLPAANPGSAAHVLILVAPSGDVSRGLPQRLRCSRPSGRTRSTASAGGLGGADARADSIAAVKRDTTRPRPAPRADSAATAGAPAARLAAQTRQEARPQARPHDPAAARGRRLGAMIPARANRLQLAAVLLLLLVLHFYIRPRLWGPRVEPRFPVRRPDAVRHAERPGAGGARGLPRRVSSPTRSRRLGSARACWPIRWSAYLAVLGQGGILRRQPSGERGVRRRRALAARLHRAAGERRRATGRS